MYNQTTTMLSLEYSPIKFEYTIIFIYFLFSIILTIIILEASYCLSKQNPDLEKLSAYECGFEPYEDTKHVFNIRFCVIAILFILFDLEIMFLIPWCASLSKLNMLSFWSMIDFLLELGVGLFYVWYVRALDWD